MFRRNYWLVCFALFEFGCVARLDFAGMDAGAGTGGATYSSDTTTLVTTIGGSDGGSSGLGGALNNGGDNSTLSGGTNGDNAKPCDPNADICESPVVLAANQQSPCAIAVDATHVYWADCVSGKVMKVPIHGGTPTTLASGQDQPHDVAVLLGEFRRWLSDETSGALKPQAGHSNAPNELTRN